jgi:sugar phosphate isomerase/epimerase
MTFKSHISAGAQLKETAAVRPEKITLAVSAHWFNFPEKPRWGAEHGFGLEYAPDPDHLEQAKTHLMPYINKGIPIRHHAYFPGFEIGDPDPHRAQQAMNLHFQALDAIKGLGSQIMTVHIGLPPCRRSIDPDRGKQNLTALVAYGKNCGIQVNLENLKSGPTSHPETLLEWVEASGASITMDIGHAVSSKPVQRGDFTVPQIVDLFGQKLDEVHLYEYETDTHHAPKDLSVLGPIPDRLILTNCRWWTIELDDYREIRHTHELVKQYLTESSTRLSLL